MKVSRFLIVLVCLFGVAAVGTRIGNGVMSFRQLHTGIRGNKIVQINHGAIACNLRGSAPFFQALIVQQAPSFAQQQEPTPPSNQPALS
jgi:hypothetical protein